MFLVDADEGTREQHQPLLRSRDSLEPPLQLAVGDQLGQQAAQDAYASSLLRNQLRRSDPELVNLEA